MRDLAVPPYALDLNTAMQTVATAVLWGGTILLLLYAFKMSREERSPFPVLLVVSVAVGSLIEPLYDIAYHLYWLDDGEQWTLFTSFGLPQPVWVMPAYVMVFGLPALVLYRRLVRGTTLKFIFAFAALTAFTTTAFEIAAINLDLYKYYGEQPMNVAGYPLHIGFMEAAQITGFAVLAALLKLRATRHLHYLALFVIFPANFAFDTLGAGFPTIIAINTPDPSTAVMWLTVPVSIGLAATALWWTAQLLLRLSDPLPGPKPATGEPDAATVARPLQPEPA
jgi:hypothetical protein